MPELNEKSKGKLKQAILEGKVKDETSLAVFQMVEDLKDEIEVVKEEVSTAVKQVKESEVSLDKVLNSIKGQEGKQGVQGIKGDTGSKGDKGDKGEQGKEGKKGNDSFWRGKQGDRGIQGEKGNDGKNGLDGSPDTPEQVRDKLETLKEDERLDVSSIKEAPRMTVSLTAPSNPKIGDLWGQA